MGINSSKKQGRVVEIKASFLAILFSTLVLIVGLVIALFVVMNLEGRDVDDPPSTKKGSAKTTQTATPVSKTPLYPTKESRSSYKINTSGAVVTIDDPNGDGHAPRNTVLVKVEKDSLTSVVEKGADERIYPASMTKVMTLLVACENVTDLTKKLTITKEILDYTKKEGGSGILLKEEVGSSYTVEDLLYLITYKSDTIASLLIAEEIAGGEAAFVDMMNAKAAYLGLTGTHFTNCTGLYDENHYSTCKDIASIMVYALDNEMAYKCLTETEMRRLWYEGQDRPVYSTWYSGNPSEKSLGFSDDPWINSSTKIIAGKTGYTDESGFTFVTVSEDKSGQRYVNVTIGKPQGQNYTATRFMNDVNKIYSDYAK